MSAILEILIALPGAGKSTYAKNILKEDSSVIIVSSDAIRKELYGSEEDQSHNQEVFNEVFKRTRAAIKDNKHCIIDATNLSRKRRIAFLKQFNNCEKRATIFAIPFEVCWEHNIFRGRIVPQYAMNKMYRSFQPPHYAEGFSDIKIIGSIDTDALYIYKCEEENIKTPHDNPHHTFSCGTHCLEAMRYIKNKYPNEVDLQMAARFHDVSKYKCKVFHNAKGEPTKVAHYYNHENVSAYDFIVYYFLMPPNRVIHIANLISNHMVFYAGEKAMEKTRNFYGLKFWEDLKKVHEADKAAH